MRYELSPYYVPLSLLPLKVGVMSPSSYGSADHGLIHRAQGLHDDWEERVGRGDFCVVSALPGSIHSYDRVTLGANNTVIVLHIRATRSRGLDVVSVYALVYGNSLRRNFIMPRLAATKEPPGQPSRYRQSPLAIGLIDISNGSVLYIRNRYDIDTIFRDKTQLFGNTMSQINASIRHDAANL